MAGANYERIHDPRRTEHYVYRLLTKRGRTIYIGCSMNMKLRLSEHRRSNRYGHLWVSHEVIGPFNYQDARRAEEVLILTEKPRFNSEYKPRSWFLNGRKVTAPGRELRTVTQ